MALALSLGRRGQGLVWPNPAVGCVIVGEGRILGRGWTQPGGRPHGETMALAQAGGHARGATAYVSLEPCSHHAKTPPCADALIEAGVSRVVVAIEDPDPRVRGSGITRLRAAGIDVTLSIGATEAAIDHRGFFSKVNRGRPWIALKLALTIDGKIATEGGDSQWITGEVARRHVHGLRSRFDAILIGGGTAREDDPELTVRLPGLETRTPVRVVTASGLDLPTDSRLLATCASNPLWLVHGRGVARGLSDTFERKGARLFAVALQDGQLDLLEAAEALGEAGLTRVLCEGGGALAAGLLAADLVDELIVYTGGVVIGREGRAGFGPLGLERLVDGHRFTLDQSRAMGGDHVAFWLRNRAEAACG